MLRRLRWVALGIVIVIGLYALAGALLSGRYDGRVEAFRASETFADLERRREEIPAGENAVSLFADAAKLLEQVPDEHALYAFPWGWDADDLPPVDWEDADPEEAETDWRRPEWARQREALPSLGPFVAALATALERPSVQFPLEWSEATDTLRLARKMLSFRARLMPEHAAESADLLLRLGTRWRSRDVSEPLNRYDVMTGALRIVRDVLASDPEQAEPYAGAWREWLAAEDPLAEFRFQCATHIQSTVSVVEQVRRGKDPYAEARKSWKKVQEKVQEAEETLRDVPHEKAKRLDLSLETPWTFRWYARPVFYSQMIAAIDLWNDAIEQARTETGLRALVEGPLDRITRTVGIQTLEQIALTRLARTALAAAAGEPLPELLDPFTGRPLAVRHAEGATIITATLPEGLRDRAGAPELFSWEVRK